MLYLLQILLESQQKYVHNLTHNVTKALKTTIEELSIF